MPKKQYVVKDRNTNKTIQDAIFSDKMEAKKLRNELNGERPKDFVEGSQERFYVSHA